MEFKCRKCGKIIQSDRPIFQLEKCECGDNNYIRVFNDEDRSLNSLCDFVPKEVRFAQDIIYNGDPRYDKTSTKKRK